MSEYIMIAINGCNTIAMISKMDDYQDHDHDWELCEDHSKPKEHVIECWIDGSLCSEIRVEFNVIIGDKEL